MKDLADGWVPLHRREPEVVRELRAAPDWPARPITVVRVTRIIVAERNDVVTKEAEEAYEIVRNTATLQAPPSFEEFVARELIGTPDVCLPRLRAFERAGIDYVLAPFETEDQQERAAQLLLTHLLYTPDAALVGA